MSSDSNLDSEIMKNDEERFSMFKSYLLVCCHSFSNIALKLYKTLLEAWLFSYYDANFTIEEQTHIRTTFYENLKREFKQLICTSNEENNFMLYFFDFIIECKPEMLYEHFLSNDVRFSNVKLQENPKRNLKWLIGLVIMYLSEGICFPLNNARLSAVYLKNVSMADLKNEDGKIIFSDKWLVDNKKLIENIISFMWFYYITPKQSEDVNTIILGNFYFPKLKQFVNEMYTMEERYKDLNDYKHICDKAKIFQTIILNEITKMMS